MGLHLILYVSSAFLVLCCADARFRPVPNPLQNDRFLQLRSSSRMDPWRPGNRNMPPASVSVVEPGASDRGADDSYLPTVNVHYDYKPTDWLSQRRMANQTAQLRRDLRNAEIAYAKNRRRIAKLLAERKQFFQQIALETLKNAMTTRQFLKGYAVPGDLLPELVSSSGDSLREQALREKVLEEWKKFAHPGTDKKEFSDEDMDVDMGLFLNLPDAKNVYAHLADQFTTT